MANDKTRVRRWNVDKPHRCPECHVIAIGVTSPRSWRRYTCDHCGRRFARWPWLALILIPATGTCECHRCHRRTK